MKLCVAGKGQIAIDGLELAIAELGHANVLVCVNENDDGVSRWQPSLLRFAKEWGVKVVRLADLYDLEDLIFLSLEFDSIIKPERFNTEKLFNIHFSKLPAYKGMYTAAWPLLNGEEYTGVTLHKIDEGIDTGDIIDQVTIRINDQDTARDLYLSCMTAARTLLERSFSNLLNNQYHAIPQGARESSYYSKSSINYSNLRINLRSTAEYVARQVRALHFREYQIPEIENFPLSIGKIQNERSRGGPGKVIAKQENACIVTTIDYNVRFKRDRSWDFFRLIENHDLSGIFNYIGDYSLVNIANSNGWTPLIVAAYNGQTDICRALIAVGADINKSNQNGTTPLMYAKNYGVRSGDFSTCKLLLDSGCDLLKRDRFGRTVVDYARINKEKNATDFFGKKHAS
jgi:methionyl-tRNA formyltransferase